MVIKIRGGGEFVRQWNWAKASTCLLLIGRDFSTSLSAKRISVLTGVSLHYLYGRLPIWTKQRYVIRVMRYGVYHYAVGPRGVNLIERSAYSLRRGRFWINVWLLRKRLTQRVQEVLEEEHRDTICSKQGGCPTIRRGRLPVAIKDHERGEL